jgi:hypothetical protein
MVDAAGLDSVDTVHVGINNHAWANGMRPGTACWSRADHGTLAAFELRGDRHVCIGVAAHEVLR